MDKNTQELDFEALKPYQKRQFVHETADLLDKDQIASLYESLLAENIGSSQDLEEWVLKRSELEAALDQAGSALYIRMTCQTDNQQRAQAYQDYIENIAPVVKALEDRLNKKFVEFYKEFPLDEERYGIYIRAIKTDLELFKEENIELQKKVELLSQQYQAICGKQTIEFQGKEITMPEAGKFLLEPDRELRETVWKKMSERRLKDKDELDRIFDDMIQLRVQIAKNAGFDNFIEYKFRSLHRFDYTPQDCKQYHNSVEKIVVPVWKEILKKRKNQMQLDSLRPWDTAVDPLGREPLKPFNEVEELKKGCLKIFQSLDEKLGNNFKDMMDNGLLDLASRKGKAPGGYQSVLNEARKPFIFMNAVGVDGDVRTLLHEGGHAFHSIACREDPLVDYRHGPMEFCEVASMAMELLGGEHMSVFYQKEDEHRSKVEHLEGIVFVLAWVATIDCFQHWIYENPKHSKEQRQEAWVEILRRFSGQEVDWSGFEEVESYLWHRQLHVFEVPFYYIEYAIAQLGALQLWLNSKADFSAALKAYQYGLSFGGAKSLPELFNAAGVVFDFSENIIEPLIKEVRMQLDL